MPELREMFPQSLGFIPLKFVHEDLGNESLGLSSCRQWETIPHCDCGHRGSDASVYGFRPRNLTTEQYFQMAGRC